MPAAYAVAAAEGSGAVSAARSDDVGFFHGSYVDRATAPFVVDCKQISNGSYVQPFKLPWLAPAAAWAVPAGGAGEEEQQDALVEELLA